MREEERTIATVEHGVFGLPSPDWNEEKLENLLHFDEVCGAAAPEAPPRRLLQNPSSGGLNSSDKEEEHLFADLVSVICCFESKSFIKGYRGAWFRGKMKNIRTRRGFHECLLEYCDFPDEKTTWINFYGVSPKDPGELSDLKQRKRELMFRPSFPPFHKESEPPPLHLPGEVKVVVNDTWRVGDLVDLWCDECFWSGKIIKLDAVDLVEVELPEPPVGEGGVYKGVIKDLRPSLNWSLEKGWSVPLSQANGESWYTARLVQQPLWKSLNNESDQSTGAADKALDPSYLCLEITREAPATCNTPPEKTSCRNHSDQKSRDSISSSDEQQSRERKSLEEQPDMIGESIMELEEVANKIRWLKGSCQSNTNHRWGPENCLAITPGILHYKGAPHRYLSHLIGHEGEGSIFYISKQLGGKLGAVSDSEEALAKAKVGKGKRLLSINTTSRIQIEIAKLRYNC
ncbi:Zinc-metallopeptidase [Carex littledalei]|uniref:Zinc-metallopeptidase n=1 Tax=Carex littledalei TaxID=544730 RepID=A0A833VRB3_9POAL|nr:Zinc-metallopeptidase [Carex littledalei]